MRPNPTSPLAVAANGNVHTIHQRAIDRAREQLIDALMRAVASEADLHQRRAYLDDAYREIAARSDAQWARLERC